MSEMSDFTWTQWIPGIAVLAGCLIVGLVVAFRQFRGSASSSDAQARDLELKISDLETRRDELYERLRGEAAREVDAGELDALERAAACTLRDLDRAHAALEKVTGKKRPRAKEAAKKKAAAADAAAAAPAAPQGWLATHPLMVGFVFGAGMVAVVAVLIFSVQHNAQPGPRPAPSPGGQAQPTAQGEMPPDHPAVGEGATDPALASLEERVRANPDDLAAHKELALGYLENRMLFQAFQEAQKILATNPQDPDGLYVSGVVRMAMGDMPTAVSLLDQVLEQFPNHVLALVYRGVALQQLGDADGALTSWELALSAAGGRFPELEQMIAQLKAAPHGPGGPNAPPHPPGGPAQTPPASASSAPASTPAPPPPAPSGPRTYTVRVELPPGAEVTPGSALFVSIHDGSGGPPAASKRLADPSFPVEVTLDASDSMMGAALPAEALVQIRLDRDGDPSTEGEGDLWARGESRSGQPMTFVLW